MSTRQIIQAHRSDKRYVRRDDQGKFRDHQVVVRKSLAAHRRSDARTVVPKGQGARGDQKKS
jgi:hypothetical protein